MRRLHHLLLGLLLFLLAAPIPSILILQTWPILTKDKVSACLANQTLHGVTLPQQDVAFSLKTWADASFQRSVTKWANENFAGREIAIKGFNQLLWSTCGKSYMYSENIVAGPDNQLFERPYLEHFNCFKPPLPEMARQGLADNISRLHKRLREYKVPFLVLFTPSKAITLPDAVPDRYRIDQAAPSATVGPRDSERLKVMLAASGVPILDGAELTRNIGNRLPLPPFPKTGTHWTDLAAFNTAESVLRKLERLGTQPPATLQLTDLTFSDTPKFADADLLLLLNLAWPHFDRYAYAQVSRKAGSKARQGRLVLVGGSFVHTLNSIWEQAEVWREIDFFYYFTRDFFRYPGGSHTTPVDAASIDWRKTFGTADAVILEINEASVDGPHIPVFLKAALKGLPESPPNNIGALSPIRNGYSSAE